ncbi:MAG: 50S ribosomal protein L22 [Pseudomonadota bacterium]|nr:50S ribosomal protein L22 [Pseudomonadota bacterium]
MLAKSITKSQQISPIKMRLIVNAIRGLPVDQVLDMLSHSPKKGAKIMYSAVASAVANAENNHNMDIDLLKIHTVCVDEAATLKRMHARARGRGDRILKRSCHILVEVSE